MSRTSVSVESFATNRRLQRLVEGQWELWAVSVKTVFSLPVFIMLSLSLLITWCDQVGWQTCENMQHSFSLASLITYRRRLKSRGSQPAVCRCLSQGSRIFFCDLYCRVWWNIVTWCQKTHFLNVVSIWQCLLMGVASEGCQIKNKDASYRRTLWQKLSLILKHVSSKSRVKYLSNNRLS